jgi:hypothetical protein
VSGGERPQVQAADTDGTDRTDRTDRTDKEREHRRLIRRYVAPDRGNRRYLKLGGGILRMAPPERAAYVREVGRVAGEATADELRFLLDEGGWRERKTAAWLIAVAGREEFRDRLGELLLASEVCYAGAAYCVALASFGTPADADHLVRYLDRYLRRPDLFYDQGPALGALQVLDSRLGDGRASRFLAPGGLWQQWSAGPPAKAARSPGALCASFERLLTVVEECAEHCPAR